MDVLVPIALACVAAVGLVYVAFGVSRLSRHGAELQLIVNDLRAEHGERSARLERLGQALVSPSSGLAPGQMAPEFVATAFDGRAVTVGAAASSTLPTLLLFLSETPGELAAIDSMVDQPLADPPVILAFSPARVGELDGAPTVGGAEVITLAANSAVARQYGATWTPAAVLIAHDGRVAQTTFGVGGIADLLSGGSGRSDGRSHG